jgi:hypothetical protein
MGVLMYTAIAFGSCRLVGSLRNSALSPSRQKRRMIEARPLERVVGPVLPSVELTLDTAGTSVRLASKSFP